MTAKAWPRNTISLVVEHLLFLLTGVFSLTPPPEMHHTDVQLPTKDEHDRKIAPRSLSFGNKSLSPSTLELPLRARSKSDRVSSTTLSPMRRKFTVSRHMGRSSASSPRLTLKFQHVKRTAEPQLTNRQWQPTVTGDTIANRCVDDACN